MSILTNSPSPNKTNPDWGLQVKTGRGRSDTGAHHRAIDLAQKLFANGQWDGRGLLIVHEAYEAHAKMQLVGTALVEGVDYEFASDTSYRRDEAAVALPACPFCGETVEELLQGVLRCAECPRSFWSREDLEWYRPLPWQRPAEGAATLTNALIARVERNENKAFPWTVTLLDGRVFTMSSEHWNRWTAASGEW